MNRRAFLRRSTAAVVLGVAAPYLARAQSPLTLRFAHFAAEDHPAHIAAKAFASRVEAPQ